MALRITRKRAESGLSFQRLRRYLHGVSWELEDVAMLIRWCTTFLAVLAVLSSGERQFDESLAVAVSVAVVLYALLRTLVPLRSSTSIFGIVAGVGVEVAVDALASSVTGGWQSPFVLCAGTGLVIGGLLGGLIPVSVGVVELVAFAVSGVVSPGSLSSLAEADRVVGLLFMGLVGAFAGHAFKQQELRSGELDSLRAAARIHDLLLDLHARTAEDPWALTLRGTVTAVVSSISEQVPSDLVALLLTDTSGETSGHLWHAAAAEGVRLPPTLSEDRLPRCVRECTIHTSPLYRSRLDCGDALDSRSTSGLYAPLWVGSELVGVLVSERRRGDEFSSMETQLVERIARHAALAIENTRWISRLRLIGAEAERGRISRDLHDRLGQSLAATALDADRISMALPVGLDDQRSDLRKLAEEIRAAARQVREKLTDLRSGPTPSRDLPSVLQEFLERVRSRSSLGTSLNYEPGPRLPAVLEQEIWHIAQEAVVNAERHAMAATISVFWSYGQGECTLIVRDDGKGLIGSAPLRRDAYGILSMRERADSIGANLTIEGVPGEGTTVRLHLSEVGK